MSIATFDITIGRNVEPFAVYEHYIILGDGSEQLAYIGSCPFNELFRYPDAKQNSEWQRLFVKSSPARIKLLHVVDSADEATAIVASYCAIKVAHCNAHGHTVGNIGQVKCSNGEIYPNANVAARANDISQPSMSRHLRGKPGYRTLKGLTFSYDN